MKEILKKIEFLIVKHESVRKNLSDKLISSG